VLLGALWPGPALVLVTSIAGTPGAAFGDSQVVKLEISEAQSRAIQSFIAGSLSAATPYAQGPYPGSNFYLARQRYSAVHTCNTWVAETLRAGDLPIHSWGVIFAGQLWPQVKRLERAGVPAPGGVPALAH
jgi:hypothetical protein